jgi:hypothetical protein
MRQPVRALLASAAALALLIAAAPALARAEGPLSPAIRGATKGEALPLAPEELSRLRATGLFDFAGFITNITGALPEGNTVSYDVTTSSGTTDTQISSGDGMQALSFSGNGTTIHLRASTSGASSSLSQSR